MRIGTWNLNAKWSAAHEALLTRDFYGAPCDVWLLTEVNPKALAANKTIAGYQCHLSTRVMACGQHWAAILSKQPIIRLPDPHEASAAALINGITYCTSILPWSTCAHDISSPWAGGFRVEDMVGETIDCLKKELPDSNLVWGGDWNQNLVGGWEHVGSSGGCTKIEKALKEWHLQVPAQSLSHRLEGSHSIDHIAVPMNWICNSAIRVAASELSDHDAYIIDVDKT